MIDEKKLLQWIEDKKYVYKPDDDDRDEDKEVYTGVLKVLNMLERCVNLGILDNDADEEDRGPRFKMDENGNLTPIEE